MWCHTSSCAILDICMGWDVHVTWRWKIWKIWKPERKERKVAQNELSPRGPCWINARGVPHSMAFHVHRSSPFRVDVVHGMGQIAPQIFSTSAKVYIETANLDGETNLKTKMAGGVLRVHEGP